MAWNKHETKAGRNFRRKNGDVVADPSLVDAIRAAEKAGRPPAELIADTAPSNGNRKKHTSRNGSDPFLHTPAKPFSVVNFSENLLSANAEVSNGTGAGAAQDSVESANEAIDLEASGLQSQQASFDQMHANGHEHIIVVLDRTPMLPQGDILTPIPALTERSERISKMIPAWGLPNIGAVEAWDVRHMEYMRFVAQQPTGE